jgi:glucosamine--fructose-6-phosphate aminotransferase (isomerizing)
MCGIVAACFKNGDVVPTLVEGLRCLEYRGYDSAGLAVLAPGLPVRKAKGRVQDLVQLLEEDPIPSSVVGIAHTRWATHGVPSQLNSHPHRSGSVVLVHNGILENFEDLKESFLEEGRVFVSQTDSEVWAALLDHELSQVRAEGSLDPMEVMRALSQAMAKARGSFGLTILVEEFPGLVFFARNESPLVLGLSEDANYVASDVQAVLHRTHDFIYLLEGQCGWIDASSYKVFERDLQVAEPKVEHLDWDAESVGKSGYEHFMLKEIEEQGIVLANTLSSTTSSKDRILPDFQVSDDTLRSFDRIVIVACGTALHAGRLGRYILEEAAGIPVDVDFASEFRYRNPLVGERDLLLAISQSGETADTLGAVKVAREKGATAVAICNVRGSSLCRLVADTILTQCGPEIGVASTKAFTAQVLAIHLFAMRVAMARRQMGEEELLRRLNLLRASRNAIETLLSPEVRSHIAEVAKKYAHKSVYFFLGRGADYPIAMEGALKLKEISYLHAEGYPAGEMKHGPLALVSEDMVVVALAGEGATYEKVLGNMQEVKTRGAKLVVLTNTDKREAIELADDVILIPRTDSLVAPLLHVIPLQYLAYFVALERGCEIDKPRNLAKSVTVE